MTHTWATSRWARGILLGLSVLLAAGATTGMTSADPGSDARKRQAEFPYCAWWTVTTPSTMNVAFPDTSATYWTTPFIAKPGESIIVQGTFPESRFMSLTVYDNTFDYFTNNGVSSQIDDYQIIPDRGSKNPWAESAKSATPAGGAFTIPITPVNDTSIPNMLPILPSDPTATSLLPARVGFLIFRVYLPEGGLTSVALPSLTLVDATGKRTPLSRCTGKGQKAVAKTATGLKLLALLKKLKDGDSGAAPEPCTKNGGVCPPDYQFFRPTPEVTGRLFPNDANAYAAMTFPPMKGEAIVIRMLAPSSPSTVDGGTTPVPWPTTDYQVRYWSMCNNIYAAPFPVVANRKPSGGITYGCIADKDAVVDESGYATFVITKPTERPANATAAEGYNWLPTSLKKGSTTEMVSLRNMLPSESFTQSVLAAPTDGQATNTQAAMGEYYPEVGRCSIATFAARGATACFDSPWVRLGR